MGTLLVQNINKNCGGEGNEPELLVYDGYLKTHTNSSPTTIGSLNSVCFSWNIEACIEMYEAGIHPHTRVFHFLIPDGKVWEDTKQGS